MVFLALVFVYFSRRIYRDARWALLVPDVDGGWLKASAWENAYLGCTIFLPQIAWCLLLYGLWRYLPRLLPARALPVLAVAVGVGIDIDLRWYSMALHHATLREAHLLITEGWKGGFGLKGSDVGWILRRGLLHGLVVACFVMVAARLPRWQVWHRVRARIRLRWPFWRSLTVVMVAVLLDGILTGKALAEDNAHWRGVVRRHPLRVAALDRICERAWRNQGDLMEANQALARQPTIRPQGTGRAPLAIEGYQPARHDVLLLTIESLNPFQLDEESAPYWHTLAKSATLFPNHYATGNVTEYGILGLLYGDAVTFYGGQSLISGAAGSLPAEAGARGSPFIGALNAAGYDTRAVGWNLSNWADLGSYLGNFSRSTFERDDDESEPFIPVIQDELRRPGPQFVYAHYGNTHFAYAHKPQFSTFLPEVREVFDERTTEMNTHRQETINRYRNCLLQMDDWLRRLLAGIDLEHTIVIITGDHGEELFEQGHLSHQTSLGEPQIRVPFLLYAPGLTPRSPPAVSSHADVLPSLFDLLGLALPRTGLGRSFFEAHAPRSAFVAYGNRPHAPVEWAAVMEASKALIAVDESQGFTITRLLDLHDHPMVYRSREAFWAARFSEIARLKGALAKN